MCKKTSVEDEQDSYILLLDFSLMDALFSSVSKELNEVCCLPVLPYALHFEANLKLLILTTHRYSYGTSDFHGWSCWSYRPSFLHD